MTILQRIVETKRKEVEIAEEKRPVDALQSSIAEAPAPRDFCTAIRTDGINLIAEIKKKSPSAGLIVSDFDPPRIARIYHESGAAAISVLTDHMYFGGSLDDINVVKQAVPLPVLRKDFLIDEYQVYESRAFGADAILLIVEAIGAERVAELLPLAGQLGLATLVEVHSSESLAALRSAVGEPGDRYILGINNRDLAIQKTDLATTARLAATLPRQVPFVAESGIATRSDVLTVEEAGACAMLVGESLLRCSDIAAKIRELLGR